MNKQLTATPRNEYTEWSGIMVLVGGIVLSTLPPYLAIFINPGVPIGGNPPWYFIIKDFHQGIGALIGIILSISLSAIMWKRYPAFSHMNLWMTLLWQSRKAALAIYIWIQCPNLFDRAQAISPWKNFNEYLTDPLNGWAGFLVMFIAFPIALFPPGRKKRPPVTENPANDDPLILD